MRRRIISMSRSIKIGLLFMSLFIIFTACTSPDDAVLPTLVPTADAKSIVPKEFPQINFEGQYSGLSLVYPENWTPREISPTTVRFIPADFDSAVIVPVVVFEMSNQELIDLSDSTDFSDPVPLLEAYLEAQELEIEIIEPATAVTINDYLAAQILYSQEMPQAPIESENSEQEDDPLAVTITYFTVILLDGERIVIFNSSSLAEDFENYLPQFSDILASLELFEPEIYPNE